MGSRACNSCTLRNIERLKLRRSQEALAEALVRKKAMSERRYRSQLVEKSPKLSCATRLRVCRRSRSAHGLSFSLISGACRAAEPVRRNDVRWPADRRHRLALMTSPLLLLLDAPSIGLAPIVIKEIGRTLRRLRDEGLTALLSEQNAKLATSIADRNYVLRAGRVQMATR